MPKMLREVRALWDLRKDQGVRKVSVVGQEGRRVSGPERAGAQTDGEVCLEMGWESPEGGAYSTLSIGRAAGNFRGSDGCACFLLVGVVRFEGFLTLSLPPGIAIGKPRRNPLFRCCLSVVSLSGSLLFGTLVQGRRRQHRWHAFSSARSPRPRLHTRRCLGPRVACRPDRRRLGRRYHLCLPTLLHLPRDAACLRDASRPCRYRTRKRLILTTSASPYTPSQNVFAGRSSSNHQCIALHAQPEFIRRPQLILTTSALHAQPQLTLTTRDVLDRSESTC